VAAAAVFAVAAYWTIRVAYSDWVFRDYNAKSMRRAIQLTPGNPQLYRDWPDIEPGKTVEALEKAVDLDPLNSAMWVALSQALEERKDLGRAEACLLRAVDLDRTFATRRLLAEYYYRRAEARKFWPAAKAALATSRGDITELFRECSEMTSDNGTILDALPRRTDVLRRYLEYALAENRMEVAEAVAARVLAEADRQSTGALLGYCDRLLGMGRGREALAIWNGLSERKLIPHPALSPEEGRSLTNGNFAEGDLDAGFDWRMRAPGGVRIDRFEGPGAVRIRFSGKQPETCEILSQYVPLMPKRDYILTVRYRPAGIESESGLYCRVLGATGQDLLSRAGALPGGPEGEAERTFRFRSADETAPARLVFGYERARGTMRIEGSVTLRGFALSPDWGNGQ
jgi:hypothetical protein